MFYTLIIVLTVGLHFESRVFVGVSYALGLLCDTIIMFLDYCMPARIQIMKLE